MWGGGVIPYVQQKMHRREEKGMDGISINDQLVHYSVSDTFQNVQMQMKCTNIVSYKRRKFDSKDFGN